ncbi:MAG: SpoIIE family protein phosphatase, partial [Prevotella sp.]|nr:SpoIIE family protein phosphatase [Prevotella sp.]
SELRIAQAIQKNMLPKKYPPFPERDDINIYGSLVPAKEVGGDIFDFFLRDEKLFFCIGDVSGKGVPSAIVMAEIHSKFRMASAHENDPAHIMQTLNTSSCEGNDTNIFVTFFIGVLDLPSGRLRYCNAGHDFPFIVSQSAEQVVSPLPVKPNLPIGLFDDFHYEKQEIYLEYDTTLFLYTDGLTEAKNKVHKQFDTDRIAETLNNNANALPEEIIQKMNEQVHLFVEDAEQSDDLTMLAIKYTRKAYDYSLKESITLKNDIKQVKDLNSFVKSITDKLNMETSQAKNIKLAVEEAVVNVMDYAYPIGTEGDITLQALYNGRKLKFIISDNGIAFDPTKSSVADTSLSVEDRPVGGLGLLLVREMMDSINYERVNGKNTLTLITVYPKKEK